jgi:hypothetical protein
MTSFNKEKQDILFGSITRHILHYIYGLILITMDYQAADVVHVLLMYDLKTSQYSLKHY